MPTYVRGSNPIWSMVDLTGHQFDDTFYMFVLENTIPYIPASVYHSVSGGPWDNPIQFLANGTLPVDIYWDPDKVYRLEFRQGNTQSDPLIYLVENYSPGNGGDTPVDTTASATTNQITNPQFSLISFTSPLTLTSVTDPAPIQIGPGWFLNLSGTGSVTIERVALSSTQSNPTNAPYALRLTMSGWSGTPYLSQRFNQNGMLWSTFTQPRYVSSSITARIQGSPQSINAQLYDSMGNALTTVLPSTVITDSYNEFTGTGLMPTTDNTDTPPAAWIEYRLFLPTNVDIFLTSFQLVTSNSINQFQYLQDSIERQIDYTYHSAYPVIPVGAVIDFAAASLPAHYLLCNGAAISRTTYALLFSIIGTTWGVGDGSTTFNLPNLADQVIAGAGGSLFGGAVGASGGSATHTLIANELPAHTHAVATGAASGTGAATRLASGSGAGTTGDNTTSNLPFSIVQQTALMRKIIRFE